MSPSELVRQGWCQYVYAKDRDGETVLPRDPDATRYCPVGAIYTTYSGMQATKAIIKLSSNLPKLSTGKNAKTVPHWNDERGRTQQEVVTLMKSLEL